MNSKSLLLLLVLIFSIQAQESTLAELVREMDAAKSLYHDKMNELEKVAEKRWSARQKAVLEKEQNREQLELNRSAVERLYSDVARVREEKLSREDLLNQEQEKLSEAQENWSLLKTTVEQKRDDASRQSGGVFPLGFEERMAAFAAVEKEYPGDRYPAKAFKALVEVQSKVLEESRELSVEDGVIIDENGDPQSVSILRLGHALALAQGDTSVFYLNYHGEGVVTPFKWQEMNDPALSSQVESAISAAKAGASKSFPVDIMQNQQSQEMIAGVQAPFSEKVVAFLKKGGFIIVPLLLLMLWAGIIILNRIVTYAIHHKRDHKFINSAVDLLESGKISEAKLLAETKNGVLARVLKSCLQHSDDSRNTAEKSVKELLLSELPSLDKYLDTLAVLAAAAPLMGLLGTVTGMIDMFEAITKFGTGDPRLLAGGISEALITTEMGLAIAIPVLLIHNYLRNRRNSIQSEMEMYAMRILNRIWPTE